MNVVESLPPALSIFSKESTHTLDLEKRETHTQQKWKHLIESALKQKVPYYMLAASQGNFGANFYDGIAFKKSIVKKGNVNDPLTNLPIEKVEYLFLKTFLLNETGIEESIPPESLAFSTLDIDWASCDYLNYAQEGLNIHALSNVTNKKIIGSCQYIFGAYLLVGNDLIQQREGIRWLICAANNHSEDAARVLADCYQRGKIVVSNKNLAAKWGAHLRKSSEKKVESDCLNNVIV
jgi:TPR repeat protein